MRPYARERWLGCIAALFLFATPLWPQRALHLDLSGEWRATTEDRPEFARPDFDDRQWSTVRLPWPSRQQAVRWLRRSVDVPAGIPEAVLTLGGVGEYCELYVNGTPRGVSAGLNRGAPALVEAADGKSELFAFARTQQIIGKPAGEIAAAAQAWGQNDDITVVTVRRMP